MARKEISGYSVKLVARLLRYDREWVAEAPALKIASQDRTKRRALEALREAVEGWFDSCIERGVLDKALNELGFNNIGNAQPAEGTPNVVQVHYEERAPERLQFSVGGHRGVDYIEGVIPAYIAAQQLGESGRAAC